MRSLSLLLAAVCVAVLLSPLAAVADGEWRWPVAGEVLTEYRNGSDPYAAGEHRGIDIAAAEGESVAAATAGTVLFAGQAGDSGLTVSMRTDDGRFDLSYLHLGSIAVRAGERVAAGQTLGTVGLTGRRSTEAAHLHFGVRDAGTDHAYRNPLDLLPAAGARVEPRREVPPSSPGAPVSPPQRTERSRPSPRTITRVPEPSTPRLDAIARREAPRPAAEASTAPAPRSIASPSRIGRSPRLERGSARSVRGETAASVRSRPPLGRPRVGALGRAPGGGRSASAAPRVDALPAPPADAPTRPEPSLAPAQVGQSADLGWWAACLGLLLVAVFLGRSGGARGRVGSTEASGGNHPGEAAATSGSHHPVPPSQASGGGAPNGAIPDLAAGERLTSIAAPCPSTSRRRSTTSTPSLTSATRTRRSRPTSSPVTCASEGRTSSS